MYRQVRRVRSALVLAALWAVFLGAVGVAVGLAAAGWASAHAPLPGLPWFVLRAGAGLAAFGAVAGVGFAALLARAEHGRRTETLTGARTALWGAAAGGALYVCAFVLRPGVQRPRAPWALVAYPLVPVLLFAGLAAGCAWLTLAVTRRAATRADAEEDASGGDRLAASAERPLNRQWPNESSQLPGARGLPRHSELQPRASAAGLKR